MNSHDTNLCRCTACPGTGCTCGCQAAAPAIPQASVAPCRCGSDCQCAAAGIVGSCGARAGDVGA